MTTAPLIRVFLIPDAYGISTDTIYRAVNAKKLTLYRWGRKSFIKREELHDLITENNLT